MSPEPQNPDARRESDKAAVAEAWRRLRVRFRIITAVWLGWLPFFISVMTLTRGTRYEAAGTILILVYFVSFGALGLASANLCCPSCGVSLTSLSVFEVRFRFRNLFVIRCYTCGATPDNPHPAVEQSAADVVPDDDATRS